MIRYLSAEEAVRLIQSGDTVCLQGGAAPPSLLIAALAQRAPELSGVQVVSGFNLSPDPSPLCRPEFRDTFLMNSIFVCHDQRRHIAQGSGTMTPCFLGEVPSLFRSGLLPVDAVLINCSEPDSNGYCSYGISGDIVVAAIECARIVLAQVNDRIPYLHGGCRIHESQITAAVRCSEPPIAMQYGEPTPVEVAIGGYVAGEIPDGACLQIGVGAIPNAILNSIREHRHLGLHTEAMTDGAIRLIREGIIDTSQKRLHPGVSIASFAVGSQSMYDYLDGNEKVAFHDVAYTNNPIMIAQNPRVCAVNSALEVDLTGQVCADSIGETLYSGVGGQQDFMIGSALSEGGRSFIVLPSQTRYGKGRIVASLTPGAGVVTTRSQTQYVVTEYGVAFLRGKNLAQRARALISIAHPDDREALEQAACARFGYSFLRLKP